MAINRELVKNKYGGLCAYTGKPLGEDWQVDHIFPKYLHHLYDYNSKGLSVDRIENLLPAIRIVNHYKRGETLEGFRAYMLRFHERLRKLPKKTTVERTRGRIEYLKKISELFDIAIDKPFNGKFYFETIDNA
jgi:5-methylcytosine-specific restriction endonuclease McrA